MLQPGTQFAHFKVLSKLGEGGMGQVYLAEDQKLHRKVALKVLLDEYFESKDRQQRFEREARTAAQITHANVMGIYDIGVSDYPGSEKRCSYIVMEYIEGQSLTGYLRDRSPDLGAVVRLAEKTASGLAAAHRLNIVHRDIKADNIIVDRNDEPKILDFGLAKGVESVIGDDSGAGTQTVSQELTRAGKILGTVSYMSPEQARGEPVDTRSDIFSFGILLYRMATGTFPFDGGSQVSTLAKILETRHEAPRAKNQNIPPELERIIDKCLQKDPNDRYQDTRDLVVDLRNLRRQFDSGITDSVTSEVSPIKAGSRRAKMGIGQAVVFSSLAVVILLALWMFSGKDDRAGSALMAGENSLAILTFENKTGDSTLDWLETGLPEILLTDLSQSDAINIISRERVMDCFAGKEDEELTHEEMVRAARQLGAVSVLSGSFFRLGEQIRIDARLEETATGNIMMAQKVMGDDPFSLVDSLTIKISSSMNIGQGRLSERGVSSYLTSSPEAYRFYQEGVEKMNQELYDEAIDLYNRAIRLDSAFALPYMRIGMSHVFQGHQQEGGRYFALARQFESNLPVKERSLLDIYANIWLDQEFDKAFIKMESFVQRFSDDKEAHAIYGLMILAFTPDTARGLAHFDTALQLDPTYQLALSQYALIYRSMGRFDEGIEVSRKIKEYYPESPDGYYQLGVLYELKGETERAREEYNQFLAMDADNDDVLSRLCRLYVMERDFDAARNTAEDLQRYHSGDPFVMSEYFNTRANIAMWKGKFRDAVELYKQAQSFAMKTRDSALINNSLLIIAQIEHFLGNEDSASVYLDRSLAWAPGIQRINYPMVSVSWNPGSRSKVEGIFGEAIELFRARLPSESWGMLEGLEQIFEAHASADTAALIEAYRVLLRGQFQWGVANRRSLGRILVCAGQYEEGKALLEQTGLGQHESSSATSYLDVIYHLGMAEERLGNTKRAIAYYREILQYWNNADVAVKMITDTKERLAALTS